MAITARDLDALRTACGVGISVAPDVAEYLEGRSDALWSRADLFAARAANEPAPENDNSPLRLQRPRWTLDSLAAALELRVVEERLPGLLVGAYVRAQQLVLIEESLTACDRSPVVTHETGHAALGPWAPHVEISYLAMSMLFPRRILSALDDRRTVTPFALVGVVPYRVPWWAAEYRAPLLERVRQAGW